LGRSNKQDKPEPDGEHTYERNGEIFCECFLVSADDVREFIDDHIEVILSKEMKMKEIMRTIRCGQGCGTCWKGMVICIKKYVVHSRSLAK